MPVDEGLNKFIGLPEGYKLDKSQAFNLLSYFARLVGKSIGISPLVLMYYVDENKDFITSSKIRDKIVNDIFKNMGKSGQFSY